MYGFVPDRFVKLFLSPKPGIQAGCHHALVCRGCPPRPMGSTSHSYTPHGVTKAVYCLLSGAKCIW